MDGRINALLTALEQAEHFFRLGVEGAGNDGLANVLDKLEKIIRDDSALSTDTLNPILEEIFQGQKNRDLIRIADGLYHRLRPWILDLVLKRYPTACTPEH